MVGPSGVGKDTLIEASLPNLPDNVRVARRTITRSRDAGGEAHEALDEHAFGAEEADGAFAVVWRAHGLSYAIRHRELTPLHDGINVIVNASRRVLPEFCRLARTTVVLSVTARPDVLAARLSARGRESAVAVASRLAREAPTVSLLPIFTIDNNGAIADGAAAFTAAVMSAATHLHRACPAPVTIPGRPVCILHEKDPTLAATGLSDATRVVVMSDWTTATAQFALASGPAVLPPGAAGLSADLLAKLYANPGDRVVVTRAAKAPSGDALRAKIAGEVLSCSSVTRLVRDLAEDRYAPAEIAGFLVAATKNLSTEEVIALTKARAELTRPLAFDAPIVADKHSVGGVPGGRISPIVVPIVAAHGLTVPKTSSRAITSAAGTADVVECVARVDLSPEELRTVVGHAGAAMVWSGRISHSPIDDVMNAINRPLGIRSPGLDISSILSKKLAVGATHVIVDIPVGPYGKVRSLSEAADFEQLLATVASGVGLTIACIISDGQRPIGMGIGPALELADACRVLANDPGAPSALRTKAIQFAAVMIEWDPSVPPGEGATRADALLASGAAKEAFERIVAAQGRRPPAALGAAHKPLVSPRNGVFQGFFGFDLSGIARAAGAPSDKGAGVRLFAAPGNTVKEGEPLAAVYASTAAPLSAMTVPSEIFAIS